MWACTWLLSREIWRKDKLSVRSFQGRWFLHFDGETKILAERISPKDSNIEKWVLDKIAARQKSTLAHLEKIRNKLLEVENEYRLWAICDLIMSSENHDK